MKKYATVSTEVLPKGNSLFRAINVDRQLHAENRTMYHKMRAS